MLERAWSWPAGMRGVHQRRGDVTKQRTRGLYLDIRYSQNPFRGYLVAARIYDDVPYTWTWDLDEQTPSQLLLLLERLGSNRWSSGSATLTCGTLVPPQNALLTEESFEQVLNKEFAPCCCCSGLPPPELRAPWSCWCLSCGCCSLVVLPPCCSSLPPLICTCARSAHPPSQGAFGPPIRA